MSAEFVEAIKERLMVTELPCCNFLCACATDGQTSEDVTALLPANTHSHTAL